MRNNDIRGRTTERHRGVISDSVLALKDLRAEDVPEHSLHARDAFKILERGGTAESMYNTLHCMYRAHGLHAIIPRVTYAFKNEKGRTIFTAASAVSQSLFRFVVANTARTRFVPRR